MKNSKKTIEDKWYKKIKFKPIAVIYYPFIIYLLFEILFFIFIVNNMGGRAVDNMYSIFYLHSIGFGFLFMILLIYDLYYLFFSITKNSKYSVLIICLLECLISTVTFVKYTFIKEPFYISDFMFLKNLDDLLGYTGNTGSVNLSGLYLFIGINLLLTSLLIFGGFKLNHKMESNKKRIVSFVVSLIVLVVFIFPFTSLRNFMMVKLFRIDGTLYLSPIESYYKNGQIGGIYSHMLKSRVYRQSGYDENKLNDILNNVQEEPDKSLGKPNILVYFSESFWDISQLEDVKFDKPVTSNFNKLKKEGLFFNMISPTYSGQSANVEYEFLTGGTNTYYSATFIPYLSLYNNKNYYNAPSIIRELNNNGYKTSVTTTVSPKLFDCAKFYEYAGFNNASYDMNIDVEPVNAKGQYVSDATVINNLINEVKNKEKGKPIFDMVLTMETHYPYPISKYDSYDIDIVESPYSESINNAIKSYSQGLYDADKELGKLYEFIKSYDEPTIIIFFGDHLPFLGTDRNSNAFDTITYFNTNDIRLNTFRKYNTQSLVLANFNIDSLKKENEESIKYLGLDRLSSYVLNHMDINISNYYKWVHSTKNVIGASNNHISVNQKGELYFNRELTGEMKDLYDLRNHMQYYQFIR